MLRCLHLRVVRIETLRPFVVVGSWCPYIGSWCPPLLCWVFIFIFMNLTTTKLIKEFLVMLEMRLCSLISGLLPFICVGAFISGLGALMSGLFVLMEKVRRPLVRRPFLSGCGPSVRRPLVSTPLSHSRSNSGVQSPNQEVTRE